MKIKVKVLFCFFPLYSDVVFTCADSEPVYGNPGTIIDVMIPEPTVPAGVSDVTFTYTLSSTQQTITTPYLVTVPMSGTTTVSVTVTGSQSSLGLQDTCVYSFMVTGQFSFFKNISLIVLMNMYKVILCANMSK